jgi:hypothetical protein
MQSLCPVILNRHPDDIKKGKTPGSLPEVLPQFIYTIKQNLI